MTNVFGMHYTHQPVVDGHPTSLGQRTMVWRFSTLCRTAGSGRKIPATLGIVHEGSADLWSPGPSLFFCHKILPSKDQPRKLGKATGHRFSWGPRTQHQPVRPIRPTQMPFYQTQVAGHWSLLAGKQAALAGWNSIFRGTLQVI